jgi:hypothetical protein
MADNEARLIGKRVKLIRNIINEGGRLSVEQFSYLLGETGDKLRNYELGRAAVPNRVLQTLYARGFSITFIVTGEGEVFNGSPAGQRLKKVVAQKNIDVNQIWNEIYEELQYDSLRTDDAKARKRALRAKALEQQRLEKEAAKLQKLKEKEEANRIKEENKKRLAEEKAKRDAEKLAANEAKVISMKEAGKRGRPAKQKAAAGDMHDEEKA